MATAEDRVDRIPGIALLVEDTVELQAGRIAVRAPFLPSVEVEALNGLTGAVAGVCEGVQGDPCRV